MPAFEVEIESGAEIVYDVQIAGTLKDLLPADYLTMTSLKVKGYLNGADIAVIREMSAWDIYNPENISTKLVNLDMSEASIVASDDKYYGQLTTSDNTIGKNMFAETILENIFLPKTVTSIDEDAFNNTHLKYINIPPSVLSLHNNAFPGYCQFTINITDLVAWFNIEKQYGSSIYEYKLMLNNEEVKAITIPLHTSSIKNYTFYLCKSIESVEIPETVTELGTHIFYGCSNLTNVVLPNSIEFISPYTFSSSGLKEVTIGNGVTTIWYAAFSNCPIEKFYSHTAVPPILKSDLNGQNLPPFQNVNKETATLYVPIGCKAAYEATEWNNYFTIVEMAVE